MKRTAHTPLMKKGEINGSLNAVTMDEHRLSYADLLNGATGLASFLFNQNPKPQQYIGVFMSKSPLAVVAIYGILMAGCIYVPLDVQNSSVRTQKIIENCGIKTIVTTHEHYDYIISITSGLQTTVLTEDADIQCRSTRQGNCQFLNPFKFRNQATASLNPLGCSEKDLATVLYTSGSSGTPKGVMISHRSISHFAYWATKTFNLKPSDNCASHAPFHFDLSLFDLFAVHHAGATTVLIPSGQAGNPKSIANQISLKKISVWQSVPSILTMLVKYSSLTSRDTEPMRHVLFAGERLPLDTLKALFLIFPHASFHNIYGATETNDTFMYSLNGLQDQIPDPLPIGRPLNGVKYKILDNDHTDVEPGQEGELYVRAPTMMKGYRNQIDDGIVELDDKTPGENRYYRTRDIVRMLPSGDLHFCGRNDDIIKSNGYRINLLEIERCLQSHKDLKEIAAFTIPDPETGHRVVAAVVPANKTTITEIELKIFCGHRLAKYLIPYRFLIQQSSLPKTSSGKIDKKRLKTNQIQNMLGLCRQ